MSITKTLSASFALAATALAGGAAAAQEIILYEHSNYTGREIRVTQPVSNLERLGFNDRASSFRIVSGEWELCQHDNYNGHCDVHQASSASMGRMNDQLTSLRPALAGPGYPGRPGEPGFPPDRPGPGWPGGGDSITLYSGYNYTGRSVTLTRGEDDFSRSGFNDQARSIRHSGRSSWRVCTDSHFRGACMEVRSDVPSLSGGMAGSISSAEPDSGHGGGWPGGPGGGSGPRDGVFLYDGANFSGQRVDVGHEVRDLRSLGFNDRADSLIVARGERWLICEDSDFRGRCTEVDGEERDLSRYGLRNEISSLRRLDGGWGGGGGWPGGGGYSRIDGASTSWNGTYFSRPSVNGQPVDACLGDRRQRCGWDVADQICRSTERHHRATDFDYGWTGARTWFLGERRACYGGECRAIINVRCE